MYSYICIFEYVHIYDEEYDKPARYQSEDQTFRKYIIRKRNLYGLNEKSRNFKLKPIKLCKHLKKRSKFSERKVILVHFSALFSVFESTY